MYRHLMFMENTWKHTYKLKDDTRSVASVPDCRQGHQCSFNKE